MPNLTRDPLDLDEQMDHLLDDYSKLKGNDALGDDRKNLISLITSFRCSQDKKYDHQAALGILIYGVLKISHEYKFLSVEKRSKLFSLLKKCLNVSTTTPLDHQEVLIHLTHLYYYLKKYPRKLNGESSKNIEDSAEILIEIESFIKKHLALILKQKPSDGALHKNFIKIADEYKPRKRFLGYGGSDPRRERDVRFIKAIESCIQQTSLFTGKDSQAYAIRYGTLLYIMSRIESEYTYRSPEYSSLYCLCQNVAGIKSTLEIKEDLRKHYKKKLIHFVGMVQDKAEWKEAKLEDSDDISTEMLNYEFKSYFQRFSSYVVDSGVRYGVQIAIGAAAVSLIGQYQITGLVVSQLGRLVVPQYAMLVDRLVPILNEQFNNCVIKVMTCGATALIIEPIGKPIMVLTYSSMGALLGLLSNFGNSEGTVANENLQDDLEFLKVLPVLPETVFPEPLKEKMKYLVGFEYDKSLGVSPVKAAMIK